MSALAASTQSWACWEPAPLAEAHVTCDTHRNYRYGLHGRVERGLPAFVIIAGPGRVFAVELLPQRGL